MLHVPSVGRVVHFVYGETHLPAIIVEVPSPELPKEFAQTALIGLFVMGMDTQFTTYAAHDEETKAPTTWHWPEYVPASS